jgi:hypothetical protein
MRLGVFVGFLAAVVLLAAFVLPVPPATLPDLSGPTPSPPSISSCIRLKYAGAVSEHLAMPTYLELSSVTAPSYQGRPTYQAHGDGDPLWRHGRWVYAGSDSIDIMAHHQALLRLPRQSKYGVGRAIPYRDGTIVDALLNPRLQPITVHTEMITCAGL